MITEKAVEISTAHEGVERGGRGGTQDAPAAGQPALQDDAKDRQRDGQDGVHDGPSLQLQ
ncbi:MAG: hypothetical protein AB7F22_11350 [Reyranella sp.]|uniref:hypothetical protein n=1 Tax=Reyranella sp. TaxID=1929291 RepID=UPI003D0F57CC